MSDTSPSHSPAMMFHATPLELLPRKSTGAISKTPLKVIGIFDHPRPDAARHDVVVIGSADAIAAARVSHHAGIAEIEMALQVRPQPRRGCRRAGSRCSGAEMAEHHDPACLDQAAVTGQTRTSRDAAISINGSHDIAITGQPNGHIVVPQIAGRFDIARRTRAGAGVVPIGYRAGDRPGRIGGPGVPHVPWLPCRKIITGYVPVRVCG